ncbi:Zinc finger, C2H2 [Pleurostoma richardsiae]|uniref:Zinc finger, C2H2 n=1 Tax=Pleurostoma richardsiae TaxID=41990 RepID=A0AA38VCP9_9PEZI|nr:Zinc finger, C2H2 [Pleurostoma richardsiae]
MASPAQASAPASAPPPPESNPPPLPQITSDIPHHASPPAATQAVTAQAAPAPSSQPAPQQAPPSVKGKAPGAPDSLFGVMKPARPSASPVFPPAPAQGYSQRQPQHQQQQMFQQQQHRPPPSSAPAPAQRAASASAPAPAQWGQSVGPGVAAGSLSAKPTIMDPPQRKEAAAPQPASNFPSPDRQYANENPKFGDDCTRIAFAIQQAVPEAVRRVVRDNWQKCLLGSDFHQAFIMNATIHHASPSIFQRAIRDFGRTMVRASAQEIVQHFSKADLDNVAEVILANASDQFLDRALAHRLRTIEAKPLINALARAERLGYEPSDIVEDDHQHERVIPFPSDYGYPNGQTGAQSALIPAEPARPTPGQRLQCDLCYRTFSHISAYDHHTKKRVCARTPNTPQGFKFSCPHCGQGFTTIVGLQYHNANKVCGDFGDNTGLTSNSPIVLHSGNSSPVPRSSQLPPPPSQPMKFTSYNSPSTPASTQSARMVDTPGSGTPSGHHDAYAHLTPEQKASLEEELRQAEIAYSERMRAAHQIPDDAERETKLAALSNSFGTKQSLIRKKYGVRLRQRRTRAEIEAERQRMSSGGKDGRAKAPAPPASRQSPATPHPLHSLQQPATSTSINGNTAGLVRTAEEALGHDAKRQRVSDDGAKVATANGASAQDTPSRKSASIAEMGNGLASAPATTATRDPTLPPPSAQPPASQPAMTYHQSGARVEIHEPAAANLSPKLIATAEGALRAATSRDGSATSAAPVASRSSSFGGGTLAEPISLDGNETTDVDSSDDEDIPPTLPLSVRKSLPPTPPPPASSGH